jgi:hypothetical protein
MSFCHCSEHHYVVVLSVVILSVPVLSGIMLNIVMLAGGLLSVVMQSCHCSEYCYPERRDAVSRYSKSRGTFHGSCHVCTLQPNW